MPKITHLTIHCAATPEGRDVKADTVKEWDIAKFGQASYHHVIEIDGEHVTHLADDQRGAHVGGHNTGNIGICYVGGTDAKMKPKDTRTREQKVKLRTLVRTYQERYPGIFVLGHNEWPGVKKACPSFDVSKWLAAGMPVD